MPPIVIAAGLATAGTIGGAIIQSKSAGKAADQQVQATDKGLALQKQIYEDQKAGMQPYADFGRQGLSSLGALMGFPALPAGAPASAGLDPAKMAAIARNDPNNPASARETYENTTGEFAVPRAGTLGSIMSRSSYSPAGSVSAASGRTARLQAPTGEIADVPEGQVEHFVRRGAQRVG